MNLSAIREVETPTERWNKLCARYGYIPGDQRVAIKREIERLQAKLDACQAMDESQAEDLVICWTHLDGGLCEDKIGSVNECRAKGMTYRDILVKIEELQGWPCSEEEFNYDQGECAADRDALDDWERRIGQEDDHRNEIQEKSSTQYGIPEPWGIES